MNSIQILRAIFWATFWFTVFVAGILTHAYFEKYQRDHHVEFKSSQGAPF